MQTRCFALPAGLYTIVLPRWGQTLKNARTSPSSPRTITRFLPAGWRYVRKSILLRDLALVARDEPRLAENLLLLFGEDALVGVEQRVDVVRRRQLRRVGPLGCGARHAGSPMRRCSWSATVSAASRVRSLKCSVLCLNGAKTRGPLRIQARGLRRAWVRAVLEAVPGSGDGEDDAGLSNT